MSDPQPALIERLLDEFVERLRQGQLPSIAEYERSHPECAAEIRELFPAVQTMEEMARRRQRNRGAEIARPAVPERLGDYRIVREIGRGGMGIVYEAEQESLARRVAVKVLPQCALLGPQTLQRFHREGRTAARLHHTNIVPVFGVGEHQGFHYIVMQLIRGVGLDKVLLQLGSGAGDGGAETGCSAGPSRAAESRTRADVTAVARALVNGSDRLGPSAVEPPGPPDAADTRPFPAASRGPVAPPVVAPGELPAAPPAVARALRVGATYWQSVAQIGVQAARALQYAHACGTLHRDIKPANLLLDVQGTVWVSDFGLAKAMEQDEVSRTGDIVGTMRYLAPERFHGPADARSDIYSLGLSLYEMLTLRPAFEHSHPGDLMRRITTGMPIRLRAINPQIPRDLETIVLKAIAREPAHRYRSAQELADDLERFLDDRPICARRVGVVERLWRWSRRNRAVASLAGLASALLILVAVVASVGYVQTTIANRQVREALAGESQQRQIADSQRQKAEALSELTLAALGDVFAQFAPSPVSETSALAFDDPNEGEILVPAQPVLSKEAAALLDRMLVFYERLAQQNPSDPRLRVRVADANRRVGVIHRRLGHLEQAQTAYLRAIETYRQLAQVSPGDAAMGAEIARIYNDLGDLCWTARWEGEGRAYHVQALAILKAMPVALPAPPQLQFELAQTHYFLGRGAPPDSKAPGSPPSGAPQRANRDRRGPATGTLRPDDGLPPSDRAGRENEAHLEQAIQLLQRLIAEQPSVPDYRHLLACCYRDLPPRRAESASPPPFEGADKAIDILRKLVDDFPAVPEYRYDLSKTYAKLDLRDPAFDASLYAAAEERLRQALSIAERLVAEYPNVPDYTAAQVQILYTLSEALRHTGRPDDVETALRKALALQASLVEQFPQAAPYRSWKAILQDALARLLANRGQTQEARALLESAVAALEELLKNETQASYAHNVLGRCYQNLADVLTQMGEAQAAAEMLRRGRSHRPDR